MSTFKLEGRPKNHGQKKEVQISNLKVDKSVQYKRDRGLSGKHFDQEPTKQHQRHPFVLQNQGANWETQDQSQRQLRENRKTQKKKKKMDRKKSFKPKNNFKFQTWRCSSSFRWLARKIFSDQSAGRSSRGTLSPWWGAFYLRFGRCKLQVAGCRLQVAGCRSGFHLDVEGVG